MLRRRLPPFAAMRAFEAVAHTLSFTRAAESLGVTQAAVSRQVRALENELGVRLVERNATHNRLTTSGTSLHIALRDGLDGIEAAVQAVSSRPWRAGVTVSVAPYFSAAWLTPRIMRFLHARPDIDLRLHHSYLPPDYRRDQVDIGINWGGGNWPGVVAEWVFDGSLTPVCSPEYLRSRGGFQEPGDMLSQPLFFEFRPEDWMQWFAAAQVPLARPPKATRIDDSSALRRIALDGNGIVLFFRSLAKEDLELGKLVQPFPQAVDTGCHYFLNYPADRNLPAAAQAFRRWLKAELPDLRA